VALRQEDLKDPQAQVLEFPTLAVRRRAARQQQIVFLRRRVTVAVAALVLAAGLGSIVGGGDPTIRSAPGSPRAVRIQAGDTLWALAGTYAPGTDPRAFVDEVLRLNGLDGPPAPGERIKLPRSS
jgi:hypothetical protein